MELVFGHMFHGFFTDLHSIEASENPTLVDMGSSRGQLITPNCSWPEVRCVSERDAFLVSGIFWGRCIGPPAEFTGR